MMVNKMSRREINEQLQWAEALLARYYKGEVAISARYVQVLEAFVALWYADRADRNNPDIYRGPR